MCGLIICSPIFLAAAIAIKIQDGGPVFYRQKRLTLNGKPFYLTKFRSMVVNAESATGAVLAGKKDSRITKVGAFLRATRTDELPLLGADGYAAEKTDYGLTITKLLGVENGGSYGCYVNDTFVTSLADAVKEGDHVYAYSYKDLTAWSDAYSYFDKTAVKADGEITLKLSYIAFDESYNPVETPAAGAVITVDGKETDVVTGEDGTAVITVEGAGEHIISAVSDTMTLVPPVCVATVG